MDNIPRVGVGILVEHDGKVLLGKRLNSHGAHTWAPPGGHLEFGESIEDCAMRELKEETSLEISQVQFEAVTNDVLSENKHYVTIVMKTAYNGGSIEICEPHKCEGWFWFSWDELPTPLFKPFETYVLQKKLK